MKKGEPITIYMLRHGKTAHNENKVFQGHQDGPGTHLTEGGKEEIGQLQDFLTMVKPAIIYSSDLKRSVDTAKMLADMAKVKMEVTPLLRGKKMGPFEGVLVHEYRKIHKDVIAKFDSLPESEQWEFHLVEGAESNKEVLDRLLKFFNSISDEYRGKNLLVVTHGGSIRNMLFYLGWAKQRELKAGSVENGAFIKISYDGVKFSLLEVSGVKKGVEIS